MKPSAQEIFKDKKDIYQLGMASGQLLVSSEVEGGKSHWAMECCVFMNLT